MLSVLFAVTVHGADGEFYTPDEVRSLLGADAYSFVNNGGDLLSVIFKTVLSSVSRSYPMFLSLFGALVLASLIKSIGGIWSENGTVYSLAARLCCCIIIFSSVQSSCNAVKTAMDSMAGFMTGMIGIMCIGWGAVGNIVGGGRFGGAVALCVQAVSFVSSYCVLPLTYSCFALSLGNCLSEKAPLSELINSIKKFACTLLGAATLLFSFSLSVISAGSAGADTLAKRGVKFAAASFIPIVGSALAEATSTVMESMKLIRTMSSVAALAVILLIALPPIVVLCADKLALSCASGVAGMMSLDGEKKLIDGINSLLTVLLAATVCSAVVFTVCCALFMKTKYA